MNVAFLFSFLLTLVMTFAAVPYGKRRPKDKPFTWGEAMFAAVYVFALLFVAFGVVPHQFIDHADKNLGWDRSKIVYGPFDILKPTPLGGAWNPITITYEAIRDIVVVMLHVFYFGLMCVMWAWWQRRGQTTSTEVEKSTYGRPLVKKV